jgi:hypothetical protein
MLQKAGGYRVLVGSASSIKLTSYDLYAGIASLAVGDGRGEREFRSLNDRTCCRDNSSQHTVKMQVLLGDGILATQSPSR